MYSPQERTFPPIISFLWSPSVLLFIHVYLAQNSLSLHLSLILDQESLLFGCIYDIPNSLSFALVFFLASQMSQETLFQAISYADCSQPLWTANPNILFCLVALIFIQLTQHDRKVKRIFTDKISVKYKFTVYGIF